MEIDLLCFNSKGTGRAETAKAAIVELLQRTQPNVVLLQECLWAKNGYGELQKLLIGGVQNSDSWQIEEAVERGGTRNTVLYDGSLFSAKQHTFEELDILLEDDAPRRSDRHPAQPEPFFSGRYVLLKLTSKSDGQQLFVLNWHAPWTTVPENMKPAGARGLLGRAGLLAKKTHLPVLIGGDFNYALANKAADGADGLSALLASLEGVHFTIHNAGEPSSWEVAHSRYERARAHAAEVEAETRERMAVGPVAAVQVAWTEVKHLLAIRDQLTRRRAAGGEIDFICSMVPIPAAGKPPALSCTYAAASYITVHAGFNHGPLVGHFKLNKAAGMGGRPAAAQEAEGAPKPPSPDPLQRTRSRLQEADEETGKEGGTGGPAAEGAAEEPGAKGGADEPGAEGAAKEPAAQEQLEFQLKPQAGDKVEGRLALMSEKKGATMLPAVAESAVLRSYTQQGGKPLEEGEVLFTLLGAEGEQDTHVLTKLKDVSLSAHLLTAPSGSMNSADPGIGNAGEVFILHGRQVPAWAANLVDDFISGDVRFPAEWPAAGGGKVVIVARVPRSGRFRQRTFFTPQRVTAELVRAKEQGRIAANRLPAAEALLAWCGQVTGGVAAAQE
ncbi:hypothetical protein ABPG75_000967 [Micractinium tetrahymenae]